MAYGFTSRLELEDGTPADVPTMRSASSVAWKAGDTIPLGGRRLRVVAVRDDDADQPPALVVDDAAARGDAAEMAQTAPAKNYVVVTDVHRRPGV